MLNTPENITAKQQNGSFVVVIKFNYVLLMVARRNLAALLAKERKSVYAKVSHTFISAACSGNRKKKWKNWGKIGKSVLH